MAKAKTAAAATARRSIRCYLCGHAFDVSTRAMSTACPGCHKAIKIEDVQVKSYLPVNDFQTCGRIEISKRGRIAARTIQAGDGITCEGAMEGIVETEGDVTLGPKASWRGKVLQGGTLIIEEGATLDGDVVVPWKRPPPKRARAPRVSVEEEEAAEEKSEDSG